MKKILLLLIVLSSCKKEAIEQPATPTPNQSVSYVIINGDTLQMSNNALASYYASDSTTVVSVSGPLGYMTIRPKFNSIGQYNYSTAFSQSNYIALNGTHYTGANLTINVYHFGNVGSSVDIDFAGTYKKCSDSTVVVNVSGIINAHRNH